MTKSYSLPIEHYHLIIYATQIVITLALINGTDSNSQFPVAMTASIVLQILLQVFSELCMELVQQSLHWFLLVIPFSHSQYTIISTY